jgi:hypothetical protein
MVTLSGRAAGGAGLPAIPETALTLISLPQMPVSRLAGILCGFLAARPQPLPAWPRACGRG